MVKRCIILIIFFLLILFSGTAKDWYVGTGDNGDGSKDKPFNEIQKAIDQAAMGDVIHVTQGVFSGKLRVGYLVIDKRGLTLAGGYKDTAFSERNPFKYPTIIAEDPKSKNESFDGGFIRITKSGSVVEHQSTTIDGFWFDRMKQNGYDKKGNLSVPLSSNMKPIIEFEQMDCHILNSVFMNSANYAVRLNGDGSSVENCLFVNVNYAGIDIFGKGSKMGKGYSFSKFVIKHSTFVSAWNCCSLERGAGSFIFHSGNADITITDNIFHLSSGNSSSMGYVFKDEKNFKAEPWIHFRNNSISQMRGGIATIYMPDLSASINIDYLADLSDTHLDSSGNDEENPFFNFDKEWFKRYVSVIPDEDVSNKKVNMDHYNQMRRMLGLPLDGGTRERGVNLGTWYPVEHVKTGAFFTPTNDKIRKRGVQAAGPFPVVKGVLLAAASPDTTENGSAAMDKEYKKIDWATLWTQGESLADQPVEFTAYYLGNDSSFTSGFGKNARLYLEGADNTTHKIIQLRKIEEFEKDDYPLKGYVKIGSEALNYLNKKARSPSSNKKQASNYSFVVRGVVKKAGDKVNMGKGPQIVIDIDSLSAD